MIGFHRHEPRRQRGASRQPRAGHAPDSMAASQQRTSDGLYL
jgi:hypothetical protein